MDNAHSFPSLPFTLINLSSLLWCNIHAPSSTLYVSGQSTLFECRHRHHHHHVAVLSHPHLIDRQRELPTLLSTYDHLPRTTTTPRRFCDSLTLPFTNPSLPSPLSSSLTFVTGLLVLNQNPSSRRNTSHAVYRGRTSPITDNRKQRTTPQDSKPSPLPNHAHSFTVIDPGTSWRSHLGISPVAFPTHARGSHFSFSHIFKNQPHRPLSRQWPLSQDHPCSSCSTASTIFLFHFPVAYEPIIPKGTALDPFYNTLEVSHCSTPMITEITDTHRRVQSPSLALHVTETSPRSTAPGFSPSPKHKPPAGGDGRHIASTSAPGSTQSCSKMPAPTVLPVGSLVTVSS